MVALFRADSTPTWAYTVPTTLPIGVAFSCVYVYIKIRYNVCHFMLNYSPTAVQYYAMMVCRAFCPSAVRAVANW